MATIFLCKYVWHFQAFRTWKANCSFLQMLYNHGSLSCAFGTVQGWMISVVSCGTGHWELNRISSSHVFVCQMQLDTERGEKQKLQHLVQTGSLPDDAKVGLSSATSALISDIKAATDRTDYRPTAPPPPPPPPPGAPPPPPPVPGAPPPPPGVGKCSHGRVKTRTVYLNRTHWLLFPCYLL